MSAEQTFELQLSRFIRAPREKVFDAFVTEAAMRAWQCPRGMHVAAASVDARVDGPWRLEMRSREGSSFIVGGHYRQLQRPARLVYTWQWEGEANPMPGTQTLIEIDFVEKDGGTELRMKHSGFPSETLRDAHVHGWRSCFNKLNDLLDARGSAATITLLGDARSSYTRTARMGLAEKGVACEQWMSAVNSYLYDTMVRRYVLQYIFPKGEGGQPDRGVIDKAVAEMPQQLNALNKAYERSDFLAGNALSFADLFVAPILAYVEGMAEGKRLLSDMPHVRRAQAAIRQRPSFVATDPQHA